MVTIDQQHLDGQMRKFSARVAANAETIQRAGSKVLKVEANRLCQTLMKFTPPSNVAKAKEKIQRDVERKLGMNEMGEDTYISQHWDDGEPKRGNGPVRWMVWTSDVLIGAEKDKDKRKLDLEQLKTLYRSRIRVAKGWDHVGKRGKQRVKIWRRMIFKKKQIKELIKHLQGNLGRIKAGWGVGWQMTGRGTGIYNPPDWVTKHLQLGKPRGRADTSQMRDKKAPMVVIANSAKGIDSPGMRQIMFNAMDVRIKAMAKALKMYLKYPERIEEDYA